MGILGIIKEKVTNAITYVQENPVLDAVATSALESIPVAGNILLKMYENSRDTPEDKTEQILQLLKEMEQMNDEKLEKFCSGLEENKELILENQDYLKKISQDTSIIIDKIDSMQKDVVEVKEDVKVVKQDQKKILELLKDKLDSNEDHEDTEAKSEITILPFKKDPFLASQKVQEDIRKARVHLNTGKPMRSLEHTPESVPGFSNEELRKILLYAGGLRFDGKKGEMWGLPERNKGKLNFSEDNFPIQIIEEMKQNLGDVPKYLAKILLLDPQYKLRTFDTLKRRLSMTSVDEVRGILKSIDAVALVGKRTGTEYWALAF